MAITAATLTSDFSGFLTAEQSAPIFDKAARSSVVQQLVRRIPLGMNGQSIPVTSTKPVASWVAEGATKPATKGTMTLKTMTPKKLAAIVVDSAEVVRADPGGYVSGTRDKLAEAFALAFDAAALHDTLADGTGTGPFSTYLDQTTKTVELGSYAPDDGGVHRDIVDALEDLVADGKKLTGFALDDVVEPIFLGAVDANGRPVYIDTPLAETTAAARPGRLIGRPSFMGEGVATSDGSSVVGYAGDWSQAAWGVVGGISFDVTDQATVTIDGELVSLWENNLVAIRAEAEYGWLVNDVAAFVKFTNSIALASA